MNDLYCYEGTDVLKNKLDIRDSKTLDLIEAEQSRMAMMLMYNENFSDFTSNGFYKIHYELFKDIYDWAGKPRIINIIKRETILAGKSVWYSNDDAISETPIQYAEYDDISVTEKYTKYNTEKYEPTKHEVMPDEYENK